MARFTIPAGAYVDVLSDGAEWWKGHTTRQALTFDRYEYREPVSRKPVFRHGRWLIRAEWQWVRQASRAG